MKFSDGYWLLREGVRAEHPVQAHDVTPGPGSLTVHAPTRRVRHRGDLLKGPVVTVGLTAPMPGVIGVTITHFAGEQPRKPRFELAVAERSAGTDDWDSVSIVDDEAVLSSGELSVRVARGRPWSLDFIADGRVLTSSGDNGMGFMTTGDGGHHVREQLRLAVGELVYGLGERFGPLVKNGQVVDIWNADGGTASEQAYKNMPFYLSSAGYGVLVDHPGLVSFEVGSEAVSKVQFSVEGQSLRYFLIHGPAPKDVLRRYTALTGRPALPPAWSFGLWLSTSFTTSYDEQTVTGFLDGMRERDIPLSVVHFDCFWMRELHWCDFQWDPRTFPDPEGMLARLKARGLKVCVWINPYIAQRSALFAEGQAKGYLLRRPNGDVWQWDLWQPGMALVDFTNPAARRWYAEKLGALLDQGVDCFKTDFGERVPTDVVYYDRADPERMHNYYTYLYNRTVFDLLRERRGEGEAVVFARSATVGCQQFPVHWGGDCESTFEAMAESLRGGLSLGLSGFGFWSHDIGGFEGTPDPALFKRWIAFGLLSSHSRLHGSSSYRVPWLFDEESTPVLRFFTRLKARLMPYLFAAAVQAHTEGVPVLRAMALEFPEDPACAHLERQYLLGEDLLVAPVFSADGEVSYYLPEGTWTDVLTGEAVPGGRWLRRRYDFQSLPLLARPGSVIPFGAVDDRPDYDYAEGVTLHVHQLADGTRVRTRVPEVSGATAVVFDTARMGRTVMVQADREVTGWRVLLVGIGSVRSVDGGRSSAHPHGTLIEADSSVVTVVQGSDDDQDH
ncbi:alpha-xylosidase [Crossiella sp. CA-258035]|uniref:alpha-xylosidase n=1 Tax=Crossiella sp. CA-258035 TaxID=2981138 RepID=UPI0024BC3A94|nr:alpha-xylosidase [Crossiella sp. CA-258035]WHT22736.1 alpha-xylosidase [Crossiella sp. CA-258035]